MRTHNAKNCRGLSQAQVLKLIPLGAQYFESGWANVAEVKGQR